MSRIDALNRRYAAAASLVQYGVEILAVGDPVGARLNAAARQLVTAAREDGPGLWDDLEGAVKSLRWRLATHPQPIEFNPALKEGSVEVIHQARRLRKAVADDSLLEELSEAAAQVSTSNPVLGAVLLRSIKEVGPLDCVVVAASTAARAAMSDWLKSSGVKVFTAGELERAATDVEQSYAVGPPRFFPSGLVTAPVTGALSFVMPAWFRDRAIPNSAIAPYADGAIRIKSRVFTEGDLTEPEAQTQDETVEEDYLPKPVWGSRQSPDREPSSEEVEARKVLLSGSFALWLDDGERIRTVDPRQPVGERVTYTDVSSVHPGTYLLLRRGQTEHRALYDAALSRLGDDRRAGIEGSQQAWKQKLQERLDHLGRRAVTRELKSRGVKTVDRAHAWASPNLVRPNSDHDFEQLLQWLAVPIQPSLGNATLLRRAIYQVSAEIREQLETAISAANMDVLERDGHLSLDADGAGFRGIFATRVLAVSPHTEIISRYDARVPFEDRSGQWLE